MNIEMIKKEKHLIVLDLDGTTLIDYVKLGKKTIMILQKLIEKKHIVCIATGRNSSALTFLKEIFKKTELDSFLITYNGACIEKPLNLEKEKSLFVTIPISNQISKEILTNEIIEKHSLNFMIDTTKKEIISTSDDPYYREIFFNNNPYVKKNKNEIINDLTKTNIDCFQIVLEFFDNKEIVNNVISTLRMKYKNSITFYCGSKLKELKKGDKILVPDKERMIIKIRNLNANKGEAVKLIAGYHNISLEQNTIAFGNDINDIEMMKKVNLGIVLPDSDNNLKAYAHDITKYNSNDEGVADYLKEYFGL